MLKRFENKAQTIMEYIVLIGIVVAAMIYLFPLGKRCTQSLIKVAADQIGNQVNAEQNFSGDASYIINSQTDVSTANYNQRIHAPYTVVYAPDERSVTTSTAWTNIGFLED